MKTDAELEEVGPEVVDLGDDRVYAGRRLHSRNGVMQMEGSDVRWKPKLSTKTIGNDQKAVASSRRPLVTQETGQGFHLLRSDWIVNKIKGVHSTSLLLGGMIVQAGLIFYGAAKHNTLSAPMG